MKRFDVAALALCLGLLSGSALADDNKAGQPGSAYGDKTKDRDQTYGGDKNFGDQHRFAEKGYGEKGFDENHWAACAAREKAAGKMKEGVIKLSLEKVRDVQIALVRHGFTIKELDGTINDDTEKAIEQFQKQNGLKDSGDLDLATLDKLGFGAAILVSTDVKGNELLRNEMQRVREGGSKFGDKGTQGSVSPGGSTVGSADRRSNDFNRGTTPPGVEGTTPNTSGEYPDSKIGRGTTPPNTSGTTPNTSDKTIGERVGVGSGSTGTSTASGTSGDRWGDKGRWDRERGASGGFGRSTGATELPAGMPIDVTAHESEGVGEHHKTLGYVVLGEDQIESIQKKLKKENVYSGETNGTVTDAFIVSLRTYQKSKGVQANGLLDLQTLASMKDDVDVKIEPTNKLDPYPPEMFLKEGRFHEGKDMDRGDRFDKDRMEKQRSEKDRTDRSRDDSSSRPSGTSSTPPPTSSGNLGTQNPSRPPPK